MQVKVEHPSDILVELHVSLEPEEIRLAYDHGLRKVKAKAKVPGFRDGKVPTALLRRRYGDIIEAEGVEQIFQKHVPKAVQESQVHPVATPRVKDATERLSPDEGFNFVLECDVLPSLETVDYQGIDIAEPTVEVSDDDVTAEVAQIQKRHADAVPVTDKAIELGHKVEFSYYGNAGMAEIAEDEAVTNEVEIGTERLVAEMQDGLMGMNVGDAKEVNFTYPDDFPTEELRGAKASLNITVNSIHELIYPEMDDELAKSVGLETLDELRSRIREDLTRNQEEQSREARQNQLFDQLLEKNAFEVPERMVHDTVNTMQNLYHQSLVGQGLQPEAATRLIRETSGDASPMAERQIKIDHLLRSVQEQENVTVEAADLDAAIQRESTRTGMPLPRIKARYNDAEAKMRLSSRVMREKLIAFLLGEELSAPEPEPEPTAPVTEPEETPEEPSQNDEAPSEAEVQETSGVENDTSEAAEANDGEPSVEEEKDA